MRTSPATLLLLALAGCTASEEPELVENHVMGLTGGEPAKEGQFPSTIVVLMSSGDEAKESIGDAPVSFGMATASVVGPRHILTVAHLVYDGGHNTLNPGALPGQIIRYSNAVTFDWGKLQEATIRQTYVPDGLHVACEDGDCGVLSADVPPDVAVIEVEEDLPIVAAKVDLLPVAPGSPLIIMGYGCTNGLGNESDPSALRFEQAPSLPATALDHETPWIALDDPRFGPLVAQYFFTPGQAKDATEASICPGDSGGPVYRDDGTSSTIVGVNAYYSFVPDADGRSYTNWHTRLDEPSHYDIGAWLTSIGVNTTWSGKRCGDLQADERLNKEERVHSCDGRFELVMQGDGNLVLYQAGVGPLWATNTVGSNAAYAIMQSDGNLVLYDGSGRPVWGSGSQGNSFARLLIQTDGNLVVYTADDRAVWASGTCCH